MIWDSICNYIIVSDISQSCPIVLINRDLTNVVGSNNATVIDNLVDERVSILKSIVENEIEIENEIEDRLKN